MNNLIERLKVNKYSMFKHGTVAVICMFITWIFFGVKNIMIAFPIALTSSLLSRYNINVKPVQKYFKIVTLDIILVLLAYISSLNLVLGFIINLITIFFIMYLVISPYDLSFYKPFLMLYVFTQYASISFYELPSRILTIIFGMLIIFIGNSINRINEKSILGSSIVKSIKLLYEQFDNIIVYRYDPNIELKITNMMRDLAYRVYITRYRKYLTTNIGRYQFKIFLSLEHFNISVKNIYELYKNDNLNAEAIGQFQLVMEYILLYSQGALTLNDILRYLNNLREDHLDDKDSIVYDTIENLLVLVENILAIEKIGKKEVHKVFTEWEKGDFDSLKTIFEEYLNVNSIRFRFSVRMSITLAIIIFIAEYLGFYKVIWAIITVMSIMQPYYEDTIKRTKDRIVGNTVAIIFTGVLINLINNKYVTILVLILSLFLLYGYKDYSKISLFAATASICVSSLSENINKLIFYRVSYIVVGVVAILLVNKYIFPYKLNEGIIHLEEKIIKLNNILEDINYNTNIYEVRDLILHITLLCQKLYIRNEKYKDNSVSSFIERYTSNSINKGYEILYDMGS